MKSFLKKKNLIQAPTLITPENTISSYIELPDGIDPIEALWHTSSIALNTEKISFIYTLADDGVYFIAAPASSFLGKTSYTTPLAAALPSNEFHQGNGAYISSIGSNLFAVVIKGNKSLTSFIGDKANVIKFAGEQQQFWVDKNNTQWYSLNQYQQKSIIKLINRLSIGAFSLMMFFFIAGAGFKFKTGRDLAEIKIKQDKANMVQQQNVLTLNASYKNNSINLALKKYLELSEYVVKNNGKIINYEYKDNVLKYTVELPASITDYSFFGSVVPLVKNEIITIEKEEKI